MHCYYCGERLQNSKTIDHFVPKAMVKSLGMQEVFSGINRLNACKVCNKRKADRVLFPPIHINTWWLEEYADKLPKIQSAFAELATVVLKYDHSPLLSSYWKEWLDAYDKGKYGQNTICVFDQAKVIITYDYISLALTIYKERGQLYAI